MPKTSQTMFVFLATAFCAGAALAADVKPAAPGEAIIKADDALAPSDASPKAAVPAAAPVAPLGTPSKKPETPAKTVDAAAASKPVDATGIPEMIEKTGQTQAKPAANAPAVVPVPVVAKPEPPKELTSCAKAVLPLVDGYKQASEDLQRWISEIDAQTMDAEANVQILEKKIQDNEAAITKLKLSDHKDSGSQIKELNRDNKELWKELKAARKARASISGTFSKVAAEKVREYAADIDSRLKEAQSQMK